MLNEIKDTRIRKTTEFASYNGAREIREYAILEGSITYGCEIKLHSREARYPERKKAING